jgi:outer membrane protein TolC
MPTCPRRRPFRVIEVVPLYSKDERMTPTASRRGGLLRAVLLAGLAAAPRPAPLVAQQVLPQPPAAAVAGPAVRRLTLEEAQQTALENNKALALARLNIKEKQHATDAARKDYFPKVLGSVDYFHFDDDLGTIEVGIPSGSLGVIPPGASLSASVLKRNSTLATVYAAQPITKLIAVNAAVQLARADENTAKAQLDKGTRDLLSGVAQAYHGLLGALRIRAALELQVKLLEQVLAAQPVPEVRIGLVEARQGLVQVRGQVQELTDTLNSLLDFPPCTVLELVDPVPADLPPRCADEAAQFALGHSPEVREAEQGLAKAHAALQVARMDYLPDVAVIGGYANQTAASYIQTNIAYLGVFGSYTFWDWGKRRDVKKQRETDIALAQQNLEVVTDKVRLEARKAYGTYEQDREAYRLAGEMVQARQEAEKAAAGPAALQAKADTARAQLDQMKAEIAYRVAHAQLAALAGCP